MKTQISYNLRKCFIYHEALMVFREGENTGLDSLGFLYVCLSRFFPQPPPGRWMV